MSVSQFFILSIRGDRLVFKDYRNEISKVSDEIFFQKYSYWDGANHQSPSGDCPPFFHEKGINFCFVCRRQMLFVCTTLTNDSPSMLVETVLAIVKLIRDFLGVLSEENVRRYFPLVYELLDEVLDFGLIQELRTDRLKPFIFHEAPSGLPTTSDSLYQRVINAEIGGEVTKKSTEASVSVLTDSEHKNEVYIDVLERLCAVFGPDGGASRCQVDGSVMIKSFLQGTPTLHLTFPSDIIIDEGLGADSQRGGSGKILLDSIAFSEGVNWRSFSNMRSVSCCPPVGETTLLSYKATQSVFIPFRMVFSYEKVSDTRVELLLRVRSEFRSDLVALSTTVVIPLPFVTASASIDLNGGGEQFFEYRERSQELAWSIPSFRGGTDQMCKAKFSTSTEISVEECKRAGPITMYFEIPQHTSTGFCIQALKIEERGNETTPKRWIRNITQANAFVFRNH